VVMLERFSTSAGKLFYINDDGGDAANLLI